MSFGEDGGGGGGGVERLGIETRYNYGIQRDCGFFSSSNTSWGGARHGRHVFSVGNTARLRSGQSPFGDDTAEREVCRASVSASCDGAGCTPRVAFQSPTVAPTTLLHHSPLHLQDHRRHNWPKIPPVCLPHYGTQSRGRSVCLSACTSSSSFGLFHFLPFFLFTTSLLQLTPWRTCNQNHNGLWF